MVRGMQGAGADGVRQSGMLFLRVEICCVEDLETYKLASVTAGGCHHDFSGSFKTEDGL